MRLVVKIGSNILAGAGSAPLDEHRISLIAEDICRLLACGHEVIIVSSGAVAAGFGRLGIKKEKRPAEIMMKQAAAAVGQSALMWAYERAFGEKDRKVAQILLTRDVFTERARYINAKNTIFALLSLGVVPVINENDTVAVDEIRFGDNDQLAALVASLAEADRLVILSDVDGLYTSNPAAAKDKTHKPELVHLVEEITPEIERMAGGSTSGVGTGGMYSKILAAKKAMAAGISVHIVNGRKAGIISEAVEGACNCGTVFKPGNGRISARKGWIAYGLKSKGRLVLDNGAAEALLARGKSLLPSGIVDVEGDFEKGDPVYCLSVAGQRIAKGLVNYSSAEIRRIKGKKTSEIEDVLGYRYSGEVIHRDNLVLVK
ncbi:MAG: glutamate 5-kinase [Actinomycetota bacterium]|nr:glutamate 5-kinase [Actinomycetota bacterium]